MIVTKIFRRMQLCLHQMLPISEIYSGEECSDRKSKLKNSVRHREKCGKMQRININFIGMGVTKIDFYLKIQS